MPTPMDFTAAYEEAVAYADGGVTHYDCLRISSSEEDNLVMFVNSFSNLETNQGTYYACQFDLVPPDTEGETVGQLQITFEFLPKLAREWLVAQSVAGATITVSWVQYLGANSDPDFECRVPFYVTTVERQAGGGCVVTTTLPDLLKLPFCRRRMTKDELPGMVA